MGNNIDTSLKWPNEETRKRFKAKVAADGISGQRWFEDVVSNYLDGDLPTGAPVEVTPKPATGRGHGERPRGEATG